jgi:hypothetical protein
MLCEKCEFDVATILYWLNTNGHAYDSHPATVKSYVIFIFIFIFIFDFVLILWLSDEEDNRMLVVFLLYSFWMLLRFRWKNIRSPLMILHSFFLLLNYLVTWSVLRRWLGTLCIVSLIVFAFFSRLLVPNTKNSSNYLTSSKKYRDKITNPRPTIIGARPFFVKKKNVVLFCHQNIRTTD